MRRTIKVKRAHGYFAGADGSSVLRHLVELHYYPTMGGADLWISSDVTDAKELAVGAYIPLEQFLSAVDELKARIWAAENPPKPKTKKGVISRAKSKPKAH